MGKLAPCGLKFGPLESCTTVEEQNAYFTPPCRYQFASLFNGIVADFVEFELFRFLYMYIYKLFAIP